MDVFDKYTETFQSTFSSRRTFEFAPLKQTMSEKEFVFPTITFAVFLFPLTTSNTLFHLLLSPLVRSDQTTDVIHVQVSILPS